MAPDHHSLVFSDNMSPNTRRQYDMSHENRTGKKVEPGVPENLASQSQFSSVVSDLFLFRFCCHLFFIVRFATLAGESKRSKH